MKAAARAVRNYRDSHSGTRVSAPARVRVGTDLRLAGPSAVLANTVS
jgi:hypothetical protein